MSLNDLLKSTEAPGIELKIDRILAEIANAVPKGKTIDVDGTTYTVDELVKRLKAYKALFAEPRELRAALRKAVADRKTASPEVVAFLGDLRGGLTGALGRANPALEKLGYPARKKSRDLTVEEKLRRADKARRTRKARGTLGPRQKERLRAQGPVTIVVGSGPTTVQPMPTTVQPTPPSSQPRPLRAEPAAESPPPPR